MGPTVVLTQPRVWYRVYFLFCKVTGAWNWRRTYLLMLLRMNRTGAQLPSAFVAWTEGQLYGIQFHLFLCFAFYFLVFGCTFCAAAMFLMKQISSPSLLHVPIIVRKHKNNFQLQKWSVPRELKHGNAIWIRPGHENNKTIDPLLEMWA